MMEMQFLVIDCIGKLTGLSLKQKQRGKLVQEYPLSVLTGKHLQSILRNFVELLKIASEDIIGQTVNSDAFLMSRNFNRRKKERALKQKKKQEMILNVLRSSSGAGVTRSCSIRRPISYTFDTKRYNYHRPPDGCTYWGASQKHVALCGSAFGSNNC
ncbi:hypothetical protein COLO4_18752 [Corchorus olitorius]|uniref:Uncharacterized protein n=1 Tax=Corchorus olitorius TaxID=93759 RepID=A0A1R3J835_9ROSI|nr:hypothetical protein COLO4_18752 [Corchorus olitorius]